MWCDVYVSYKMLEFSLSLLGMPAYGLKIRVCNVNNVYKLTKRFYLLTCYLACSRSQVFFFFLDCSSKVLYPPWSWALALGMHENKLKILFLKTVIRSLVSWVVFMRKNWLDLRTTCKVFYKRKRRNERVFVLLLHRIMYSTYILCLYALYRARNRSISSCFTTQILCLAFSCCVMIRRTNEEGIIMLIGGERGKR